MSAWLIYCVYYSDGTTKTEDGRMLTDIDAQRLGILGELRHAAMANKMLTAHILSRDEKLRRRRRR